MNRSQKTGFTLIELLVVIAIIAILAAILFPVFAQAREKARQATCMSNMKQNGLALLQYVEDYDERMPQAKLNSGGMWIDFNIYTTPPDLRPGNVALRSLEWANSIQPYMKNYGVFDCPSTETNSINVSTAKSTPPRIALTFNGDLQMYPQAGILSPASVIMVWTGHQKTAYTGYSDANPQLVCPIGNADCIYQPTALANGNCPQANGGTDLLIVYSGQPNYNVWVHGQGDNFTYADGHTKWAPLRGDYHVDPWGSEDSSGSILVNDQYTYYWDGCHAYLFRPDYEP
jgi:prepilin-type N-terminal cleavage/methylation domain-containing protein